MGYAKCCYTCKHGEDYDWSGIRGSWRCKEEDKLVPQGKICKKFELDEYYKGKILVI
jgi:hypothetical protein